MGQKKSPKRGRNDREKAKAHSEAEEPSETQVKYLLVHFLALRVAVGMTKRTPQ